MQAPTDSLRLSVGVDRLALAGRVGEIAPHHHEAAAVVIGIDGPITIVAGRRHATRAAVLAPGFTHAVDVGTSRFAVFLLSPGAINADGRPPLRDLSRVSAWLDLARAALTESTAFADVDRVLAAERLAARPIDARLRTITQAITDHLDQNLPVGDLAAQAHLSPSRLMTLCREQLGTSVRAYRRWLRSFSVMRRYAAGASLTESALAAGFASSAHLSLVAREQFGLRPSSVLNPGARGAIVAC